MADYENKYRSSGGRDAYDRGAGGSEAASESGLDFDAEMSGDTREHKMPPRNILETDSAKYTAEYIKEVVKGLYTVDAEVYPAEGLSESGGYETPRESISVRQSTAPQRELRQEMPEPRYKEAGGGFRDEGGDSEYPSKVPLRPEARLRARHEPQHEYEAHQEELKTAPSDFKPEWKAERVRKPVVDKQYDTEQITFPDRRPEKRSEAQPPRREKAIERPMEAPPQKEAFSQRNNSASHDMQERNITEEAAADYSSFMKSFEDKSRANPVDYSKKPRERKTFSSLRSDGDTEALEGLISGKPPKRSALDPDRGYERPYESNYEKPPFKELSEPPNDTGRSAKEPPQEEEEYVYLRQVYDTAGRIAVPNEASQQNMSHEKIPIVINKNIESRPRKTASDYMGGNRANPGKPAKPMPVESRARGVNLLAVLFIIATVAIIGFLVWKINSMSVESKTAQSNSETILELQSQIRELTEKNAGLESEIEQLNSEVGRLTDENARLSRDNAEEAVSPENGDGQADVPAPAHPELDENGYYTVQRGDTLWKISEKFLGSGDDYLKITAANNIEASQPLYAGLKLKIPLE